MPQYSYWKLQGPAIGTLRTRTATGQFINKEGQADGKRGQKREEREERVLILIECKTSFHVCSLSPQYVSNGVFQ